MIDLYTPNEWQIVDKYNGLLYPWFVQPFLQELSEWDLMDKKVLEIGGGSSTLWWNDKAGTVITIESDPEYYEAIAPKVKQESLIILIRPDISPNIRALGRDFDIAIIDCHTELRDRFIPDAICCLKPGGILIIDNWMQESVWVATKENQVLISKYEQKVYKQGNHPDWSTLCAIIT